MKKLSLFILGCLLVMPVMGQAEVRLDEAAGFNNIISKRLAGKWKYDVELTRRIGVSEYLLREAEKLTLIYEQDNTVIEKINEREHGNIDLTVYSAGYYHVSWKEMKEIGYYVVTVKDGNPMLKFFRPEQEEGKGDWVSIYVTFVKALNPHDDILYHGDGSGDPAATADKILFYALTRAE